MVTINKKSKSPFHFRSVQSYWLRKYFKTYFCPGHDIKIQNNSQICHAFNTTKEIYCGGWKIN